MDKESVVPETGSAPRRRSARGAAAEGARLVARLYARAPEVLRQRMLEVLLKPLGPLGLAAVASGAFLDRLLQAGQVGLRAAVEGAPRYSAAQIQELVRFVEQVQPQVLQQLASLVAKAPTGPAALTAAALLLFVNASRSRRDSASPR